MNGERKMTATEQKLSILHILHLFGGLSDLKLLQFLTDQKIMNYFDMMFTLNDLCAQGHCSRREVPGGYHYSITPAGEEALDYFGKQVPSSLRDQIFTAYTACKDAYRQAQEYPAEYRQAGRGEYLLSMRIVEKDLELMNVTLSLPDEAMARQIRTRWPDIAEKIYGAFFDIREEGEA